MGGKVNFSHGMKDALSMSQIEMYTVVDITDDSRALLGFDAGEVSSWHLRSFEFAIGIYSSMSKPFSMKFQRKDCS